MTTYIGPRALDTSLAPGTTPPSTPEYSLKRAQGAILQGRVLILLSDTWEAGLLGLSQPLYGRLLKNPRRRQTWYLTPFTIAKTVWRATQDKIHGLTLPVPSMTCESRKQRRGERTPFERHRAFTLQICVTISPSFLLRTLYYFRKHAGL